MLQRSLGLNAKPTEITNAKTASAREMISQKLLKAKKQVRINCVFIDVYFYGYEIYIKVILREFFN